MIDTFLRSMVYLFQTSSAQKSWIWNPFAILQAILNHPGFKKLTILASTQLQSCRAQQLANIIWAFATLDFLPIPQFLEGLAEEAITKRSGFNPQNVANMLWAYAKLDYEPRCPLLTTLAEEAAAKLHDFNSQNVSNMLWAFAKFVFIPSRQLLDAAVNKISSTLNQFNPQVRLSICQIAHAALPSSKDRWDKT